MIPCPCCGGDGHLTAPAHACGGDDTICGAACPVPELSPCQVCAMTGAIADPLVAG